jgi:hypothetical protein
MEKTHMKTRLSKMETELDRLAGMELAELRHWHRTLFGEDHLVPSSEYLRRKIAWHIQSRAEGGLPESARLHGLAIARQVGLRVRICSNVSKRQNGTPTDRVVTTSIARAYDSRLPMPGSFLVKQFKNRQIAVKVLDAGFEYEGRSFDSLSAVAREITGTRWNGFVFFGLAKAASHAR